jgi:hypothetical protein
MPYTDLRPYDGQYSHRAAVPTIRWLPLLTVSDRCLAAPRRPPARPPCAAGTEPVNDSETPSRVVY